MIGSTEKCLEHYFARQPGLEHLDVMARLCRVDVPKVQRWQAKVVPVRGEELLRVRCFLSCAGYEVKELDSLKPNVQQLALLAGSGLLDPQFVTTAIGYGGTETEFQSQRLASLLRITLQPSGFSDKVEKKIDALLKNHKAKLEELLASWKKEIRATWPPAETPPEPTAPIYQPISPEITAAWSRMVGACSAMAHAILADEAETEALAATNGGQTMHELAELLQRILKKAEES